MCKPDCEFYYVEDYINKRSQNDCEGKRLKNRSLTIDRLSRFDKLCQEVKKNFEQEWESDKGKSAESSDELLELQKMAIIGHTKQVNYFMDKIKEYLDKNGLSTEDFPEWYTDIASAIFHENWGLAGLQAWMEMPESSSAKVIGEKIFYLENGRQRKQTQTISADRLRQLRMALLLRNPEKRLNEEYTEVYMLNGNRITIYDEPLAKEASIVLRKYTVKNYTFEEQARMGTIPKEAVQFFKAFSRIGYNVNFLGPVRSGKTTFLQTWQSYEDKELEGIQIETDPEIPLHVLMPDSPIIQMVADKHKLKGILKTLKRGDADYIIVAEARDGIAMHIGVEVANMGTRRVKSTFHISDPADFCYSAANEIVKEVGGDLYTTIVNVAKSFHYLFSFIQLKDKSRKRLKGIHELRYDCSKNEISLHQICKYDISKDNWTWRYTIGKDKEEIGLEENREALDIWKDELKGLAERYPMDEEYNNVTIPFYNHFMRK